MIFFKEVDILEGEIDKYVIEIVCFFFGGKLDESRSFVFYFICRCLFENREWLVIV